MVAVTILLSKYTILYGKIMTLVVTIQSVARRWIANLGAGLALGGIYTPPAKDFGLI